MRGRLSPGPQAGLSLEPASPRGQGAVFGVEDEEGGEALALGFAAFFEAEHVQAAALGLLGGLAVGSLLRGFFSPDAI